MGNNSPVIKSERMTIDFKDCVEWQSVIAKLDALSEALEDFQKDNIASCIRDCSLSLNNLYYKYVEDDDI